MRRTRSNLPPRGILALTGALVSLVAGFLIASYTIAGIAPVRTVASRPERSAPRIVPPGADWREAGYREIGLWDHPDDSPSADHAATGSSRL